jgi:MFS family permease
MLPLSLFQSRTFSAVNLLTLLLYAAMGGVFFFLPFALIQVHGYPATLAGTAFLPFTIIMAALSRWAGGLLDQFGARLPLIIGPAIAALGIGLMGLTVASGSYWEFLVSIAILGFGMVVTVAPLTATVIDAVPAHETGVASGINNAVASVANLLAIAILGAIALSILDHALTRSVQNPALSEGVKHAIQAARGQLVIEPALTNLQGADRLNAELILRASLAEGVRWVMLIAAAIALGGAAAGSLIPRPTRGGSSGSLQSA